MIVFYCIMKANLKLMFIFLALFVLGCTTQLVEYKEGKSEIINSKIMGPEETLDKYISYFNYSDLSDRLNKIKCEKQFASGYAFNSLEISEYYVEELTLIISDLSEALESCNNILTMSLNLGIKSSEFEKNCEVISTNIDSLGYHDSREFTILSKEIIHNTSDTIKIKAKYKMLIKGSFGVNETSGEQIYVLKSHNGIWKVDDFVDESGTLYSENIDLEERKQKTEEGLEVASKGALEFKTIYKQTEQEVVEVFNKFQKQKKQRLELENNIKKLENVIDAEVDKSKESIFVTVEAFYEPSLTDSLMNLGDDYVGMLTASSRLFKQIFPFNKDTQQIEIIFYKKEKDVYGNSIKKLLGRVTLLRKEYEKINWEGFSSINLEKIGKVKFYGKSTTKELESLQRDLEEQQRISREFWDSAMGDIQKQVDEYMEQFG